MTGIIDGLRKTINLDHRYAAACFRERTCLSNH